jgi:hypothetical protein
VTKAGVLFILVLERIFLLGGMVVTQSTFLEDDIGQGTTRRTTLGKSRVAYHTAKSILSPATGFIDQFDYTLNPYSGCTFA